MKLISGNRLAQAVALLLIATLAGCDRGEVKVQRVPKESEAPVMQTAAEPAPTMPAGDFHSGLNTGAESPQLKWTLPAGWEEKPLTQMRAASFNAKGKDGETADVSVIPMAASSRDTELVNMWRQQMRLPPVGDAGVDQPAETVAIGSDSGKLFDIASQEPILEGKLRARMLVAMLTRGPTAWFFKMTGEDSLVQQQKPAFLEFLKSISFETAAPAMASDPHGLMNATPAPADNSKPETGNSELQLPSGWREVPPTQFVLTKYVIENGDAQASVTVSKLDGEGGGLLANINRWRGQLSLPPISEEGWSQQARSVDVGGVKATLADMTGTDRTGKKARLVGVIVPQAGQTWFYKLMGDEQIVEQQKDVFTKFVQAAKVSNAP